LPLLKAVQLVSNVGCTISRATAMLSNRDIVIGCFKSVLPVTDLQTAIKCRGVSQQRRLA